MLFSCKISNSILGYLERLGADLDRLDELTDLPREFLRDSSYWIEAQRLELFLEIVEQEYFGLSTTSLLVGAGRASHELKAWGVLDSVLRMLPTPQDIWARPENLLSYFISPAPPLGDVKRYPHGLEFKIPINSQDYPRTAAFLQAALEALPLYSGHGYFSVHWQDFHFQVTWASEQESLLSGEQHEMRQLKPELLQKVVQELEHNQRRVEELTRLLSLKDSEIEVLHSENQKFKEAPEIAADAATIYIQELQASADHKVRETLNDVFRLNDYLTRALQLVTILVGQGRGDNQVREAMRRVDWTVVQSEYPTLIKSSVEKLQNINTDLKQIFKQKYETNHKTFSNEKGPVALEVHMRQSLLDFSAHGETEI